MEERSRSITVFVPTWAAASKGLQAVAGEGTAQFSELCDRLWSMRGTVQQRVDWSDPQAWIPARLEGELQAMALRIWNRSEGLINPRYWSWTGFARRHGLLSEHDGSFVVTDAGKAYISADTGILRQIERDELIPELLELLKRQPKSRLAEISPEWGEILLETTRIKAEGPRYRTLRSRINYLMEGGLVTQAGTRYSLTEAGDRYLASLGYTSGARADLHAALDRYNSEQRTRLLEALQQMDPYRFEHLVKALLERIGYENLEVTKRSGDKGIDVMGTLRFGITVVKEVVQVKRGQGTIGRPLLDQLRGSLHYFDALRGSIISLGTFSPDCKRNAILPNVAPVTLIDRDRLLDMLLENEVGVRKAAAHYYELALADLDVGMDDEP